MKEAIKKNMEAVNNILDDKTLNQGDKDALLKPLLEERTKLFGKNPKEYMEIVKEISGELGLDEVDEVKKEKMIDRIEDAFRSLDEEEIKEEYFEGESPSNKEVEETMWDSAIRDCKDFWGCDDEDGEWCCDSFDAATLATAGYKYY